MRATQLRASDLKRVDELIGECREVGYESQAWRTHLLVGLSRLVGASVGTGMEAVTANGDRMKLVQPVSCGWASAWAYDLWSRFVRNEDPLSDVVLAGVYKRVLRRSRLVTCTRNQVVDDREWLVSEHYNEYRKASEVDSCLYSFFPLEISRQTTVIDLIAIHRAPNDTPFADRERRLVEHAHRELGRLIGVHLASAREPSVFALSRRLGQTLHCMLEGASEKEAAVRLGLSQSTVRHYVSAIYQHFGVSSRRQLLARWIRFGPPLELPANLPGRLTEVLERLLHGEDEQQIAAEMGLSVFTAREYTAALYRRLGVGSRPELMGRWIRFDPDRHFG